MFHMERGCYTQNAPMIGIVAIKTEELFITAIVGRLPPLLNCTYGCSTTPWYVLCSSFMSTNPWLSVCWTNYHYLMAQATTSSQLLSLLDQTSLTGHSLNLYGGSKSYHIEGLVVSGFTELFILLLNFLAHIRSHEWELYHEHCCETL